MKKWIAGARLPTLPASIVPVLVGTAAAGMPYHLDRALLAAIVALGVQIGCNHANDYSDGIRGTDKNRTGPPRLRRIGPCDAGRRAARGDHLVLDRGRQPVSSSRCKSTRG